MKSTKEDAVAQRVQSDLRPPDEDPWSRISIPSGWAPIARICRKVHEDAARVTEHIVDCIQVEIPVYKAAGAVPREDLSASVLQNLEMMFFGLAENRSPLPEELRVRRELGHRRAMQGLPVDALLQAYHVGYRELWQELIARAREDGDPRSSELLLVATTTFWGWIQQVTDAVADAHNETTRAREALAIGARQRFVELLLLGNFDSEEMAELCQSLGFAPGGTFQAVCLKPHGLSGSETALLQRELKDPGETHLCVSRGSELLIVSREAPGSKVEATVRRLFPDAAVGVGVARTNLPGARLSIIDAERALALAERNGGVRRFEEDWLQAMVLRGEDHLRQLLSVGIEVARKHPYLADTVKAFSESGFSVAATARRLSLHPNSVTYRLDRWHHLTGWEPRSFSGLANSMAALEMVD